MKVNRLGTHLSWEFHFFEIRYHFVMKVLVLGRKRAVKSNYTKNIYFLKNIVDSHNVKLLMTDIVFNVVFQQKADKNLMMTINK